MAPASVWIRGRRPGDSSPGAALASYLHADFAQCLRAPTWPFFRPLHYRPLLFSGLPVCVLVSCGANNTVRNLNKIVMCLGPWPRGQYGGTMSSTEFFSSLAIELAIFHFTALAACATDYLKGHI